MTGFAARSEHALQLAITRFLRLAVPKDIPWTAVDHAAKLSPRQAGERKARGVIRGQADYRFVLPPLGQSFEIELKLPKTYQTPEQKAWQEAVVGAGGAYAVCRSLEEVVAALSVRGVALRASL